MFKLTKNEYAEIVKTALRGFQRNTWDYGHDDKEFGAFAKHLYGGDKKLVHDQLNLWIAAIRRLQEMLDYVDFDK